jgi:hypothetical protein
MGVVERKWYLVYPGIGRITAYLFVEVVVRSITNEKV